MKRWLSILLALTVLAAALAGCGSAKQDEGAVADGGAGYSVGASPQTKGESEPAVGAPAAPEYDLAVEDQYGEEMATTSTTAMTSMPAPADMDRKMILNAQLEIKVEKNLDDAAYQIRQAVIASGGYVQEARQHGTPQQGRTLNMTLRVPAGQYNDILELIKGAGELLDLREWSENVTEQYVDLQVRIKTQEAHLEQLQRLYERSGTIAEMIQLEKEIARVTAELESLKGRFRVLSNRVEFSTVIVTLYEPGAPTPIQEPKTIWERVKLEFVRSWHNVVNFTGDVIVYLAAALPVLAYLAVIGGALYGLFRLLRRTALRRTLPPLPPRKETPSDRDDQNQS